MSGSRTYSSQPAISAKTQQEFVEMETSGRYVGPMPVQEFLDKFLQTEEETDSDCPSDLFEKVTAKVPCTDCKCMTQPCTEKPQEEKYMYQPFVSSRDVILGRIDDHYEDRSHTTVPQRF